MEQERIRDSQVQVYNEETMMTPLEMIVRDSWSVLVADSSSNITHRGEKPTRLGEKTQLADIKKKTIRPPWGSNPRPQG